MRAYNHVLTGFTGGLALATFLPAVIGTSWSTSAVIGSAVLTAGAAALPDIDSPNSTVARIGGRSTQALARRIDRGSHQLYTATKTPRDPARRDGHRGVTHTLLGALALGLVIGLVSWLGGGLAVASIVLVLALLGRRAVFGRTRLRGIQRLVMPLVAFLGSILLVGWLWPSGLIGGALLGAAVSAGMLLHVAGDIPTDSGVPLLWPLPIRGQRWYRMRLPRRWALRTGSTVEPLIALVLAALALGQIVALLQ